MDNSELHALAKKDPVGAVVACLLSYGVPFDAQFLRDHFSGVLALPPDQIESFFRGFDAKASLFEEQAAMHYAAMQAAVTQRWSRLMSAARAICTTRRESALRVLQDPERALRAGRTDGAGRAHEAAPPMRHRCLHSCKMHSCLFFKKACVCIETLKEALALVRW